MGTEVEYGISVPGEPGANPVITSTQIVLAYAASVAAPRARRPRWDYEVESPLRDARGYDLSALFGAAEPDIDDIGAANVILSDGARLYVDHAHPEYSGPEVTNPLDAVLYDKAGERVMEEAAMLAASVPGSKQVQLYKNNTDGKGASYGTHENYLCRRDTPFPSIIAGLLPFFASRQVFAGAGRVGIGPAGVTPGFQLAQRSDYIEVEVGLETTLKRGLINTRDEPHADADRWRRLHVIIGDANLSETAIFLKVGTTALVLSMIEAGWPMPVELEHPVSAVHQISHDPTLEDHGANWPTDGRSPGSTSNGPTSTPRRLSSPRPTARTWTGIPETSWPPGPTCWTSWPTIRCASPTRSTGPRNSVCWKGSAVGTRCRGGRRGWPWSICSTPTSGWTAACTTGWSPGGR